MTFKFLPLQKDFCHSKGSNHIFDLLGPIQSVCCFYVVPDALLDETIGPNGEARFFMTPIPQTMGAFTNDVIFRHFCHTPLDDVIFL